MTIEVIKDEAAKELGALLETAKRPAVVLKAMGRKGGTLLKQHFRAKDKNEPNWLSSRRSHVWLEVADGVQNPVLNAQGTQVMIAINHPIIRQKVFGGIIKPKNADYLTLPRSEEAYNRTAETFEKETGLKLIFMRAHSGTAFLGTVRKEGGPLQVEYVLRKSVNQKPDPTALPEMGAFKTALLEQARVTLERQLRGQNPETN